MKSLAMVHIGKLDCVAIPNLEAIFTLHFTLQIYKKGDNLQYKWTQQI